MPLSNLGGLKGQLEEEELWHIWNIETDLIRCMLDMRSNGVRVDLDKAEINKKLKKDGCFDETTSTVKQVWRWTSGPLLR